MNIHPKDYETLEEYLAAVNAWAMQQWMKAGKSMPEPEHGGGGGP